MTCVHQSHLVVNDGGIDTSGDCFETVTMNGSGGDDTMNGGESTDGLCADAPVQMDTLNGGPGNDKLYGGPGDDVIHGSDGADLIDGGPGNDQIFGDGGDDRQLYGGPGNDVIHGGDGNDMLGDQLYPVGFSEDLGADSYFGDAGNDTLTYQGHADGVNVTIDGQANDGSTGEGDNVGSDIEAVDGSDHNDIMTGGPEADTFDGQGGNDTINADDGEQDRLDCGPGGDVANVDPLDIIGNSFASSCEVVNVDKGGSAQTRVRPVRQGLRRTAPAVRRRRPRLR